MSYGQINLKFSYFTSGFLMALSGIETLKLTALSVNEIIGSQIT